MPEADELGTPSNGGGNFIMFETPVVAAADDTGGVGRDFCSHEVVFTDNKNTSMSLQG